MSCCMGVSIPGVVAVYERAKRAKGRSKAARAAREEWKAFWLGCKDRNTGKWMTQAQVIAELRLAESLGHLVIPTAECPTWDYKTGCHCQNPTPNTAPDGEKEDTNE